MISLYYYSWPWWRIPLGLAIWFIGTLGLLSTLPTPPYGPSTGKHRAGTGPATNPPPEPPPSR
ncbi:hypothetical protein HEB94_009465 [Actinopolymorpha pittospori]|uniref:Uncharacterized protein n=1 Tax=Actinopolymorpha pittospori TaxID=648752 RepID=A0A927RDN5_9ACTN|nr:hypothetical protein [Actinopolymorpha pittospori]